MEKNISQLRTYNKKLFDVFLEDTNENEFYELINGSIYMQAAPKPIHQDILGLLHAQIWNFLSDKKCKVSIAPYDVFLLNDDEDINNCKNIVQPDLFVVCDQNKRFDKGYRGAPDFVIEIVSPSTKTNDYFRKLNLYVKYGVKEYWVVNPETQQTAVYLIENETIADYMSYDFNKTIQSQILDGLSIRICDVYDIDSQKN